MKLQVIALSLALLLILPAALVATANSAPTISPLPASPDLEISAASVRYLSDLDLLVFEQKVQGRAGGTTPKAKGQLDGAPVLGYVFPTTLTSQDVGFGEVEGIVSAIFFSLKKPGFC